MAIGATDLAIFILVAAVGLSMIVGLVYLTHQDYQEGDRVGFA